MKRLTRYALAVAAWMTIVSTAAANESYKIDPAHSTISFKVNQFLAATTGKFRKFSGTIEIDREQPEKSSVVAKIDARSVDTRNRKRDDHLRSADFFNVAKYPEITFKSRSVKQTGKQNGDIMGDLTMHGVTRPVALHVELMSPVASETKRTRWTVTTNPLKRRDFGLMFGRSAEAIFGISQSVALNIEIEAVRGELSGL